MIGLVWGIIQANHFIFMSLYAFNLFKAIQVMDSDVASPVSTCNMFPIRTALYASQHLLVVNTIDAISSRDYSTFIFTVEFIQLVLINSFLFHLSRLSLEVIKLREVSLVSCSSLLPNI
jgi:hypothetical protein